MFILYSFLLTIGFVILSPRFLFDALRRGKYAAGFSQRMGRLPEFDRKGKPVIWLHCVSVGETQAARPLVDELLKKYPDHLLVVSTITKTGQELAQKIFADKAALVFYFPFDWKFAVRRALKKIEPQVVLLMETELWFRFLREAHYRGTKLAIVNGRLSEKSVNGYMYIRKFMHRILHYIDLALMQGQDDARRIKELGMKNSRIRVTGNIKFDLAVDDKEASLTEEFRFRFAVLENTPLIVAASTHSPEEELILGAFAKTREQIPAARLMLVPRHPERFDEVASLIKRHGYKLARRSDVPHINDELADVILLDSIGELRAALPLAQIVFSGGSLIPHGGQNILEPAAAKKPIMTGHYTMNFAAIVKEFVAQEAVIQLPQLRESEVPAKLAEVFIDILRNDKKRERLATNSFALIELNSGAAAKTADYLKPLVRTTETIDAT